MALRSQDLDKGAVYSSVWLRAHGMHHRELASSKLTRVLPGQVTRTDAPAGLRAIALVAQRQLIPGAVISRETAAELFRIPLPDELTHEGGAAVHLRVSDGAAARRTPLINVHRQVPAPVIRHHGVVMSHPVVAVQGIAPWLSHAERVICLDALVADRHGAAARIPLPELFGLIRSRRGRGAAELRAAAIDVRERVWSPRETRMRLMLLGHGYPEPELNRPIRDPATGIVYYIDLAYPRWSIAIEYDGRHHLIDPSQQAADLHKNEVLHVQGWSVLRVSAADLHRPGDFFLRLEEVIHRRARYAA